MIELVSESRCIQCNLCVVTCPTNVFDKIPGKPPTIARKSDCQTCYICELYCPVDALYVAPEADKSVPVDEQALVEAGLLGSYREDVGWGRGRTPAAQKEKSADYYPLMQSNANLPADDQGRIIPWSSQSAPKTE